jgi:hypothetical protein
MDEEKRMNNPLKKLWQSYDYKQKSGFLAAVSIFGFGLIVSGYFVHPILMGAGLTLNAWMMQLQFKINKERVSVTSEEDKKLFEEGEKLQEKKK